MNNDSESLLTVIVCCFNASITIVETVQSIQNQTLRNFSLLIIDDGSSDDSPCALRLLEEGDSRIKVLFNSTNRGIAYSRMRGLEEASTNLVVFFDADDIAEKNMLSLLYETKEKDPNIIGVSCFARYFIANRSLGLLRIGSTTRESFFKTYHNAKLVFLLPVVIFDRRDALSVGGYRLNIMPNVNNIRYEDYSEDLDLWCRMSDLGAESRYFLTVPEPLFGYRKSAKSLSTRSVKLMQIKMRWIKDCLVRRRSGISEITLLEFLESRSLLTRFKHMREDVAASMYKKAGFAFSRHAYFSLVLHICLASVLSPTLVGQKIRTQSVFNKNN